MTLNTNHLFRRTSYEMQTLSDVGKLKEIMEKKMKENNMHSVEFFYWT
jgi:hypothetical protein